MSWEFTQWLVQIEDEKQTTGSERQSGSARGKLGDVLSPWPWAE
ncbi:MAG: hypothetical protein N0C81_17270 [Candidatus Thiodiazotropha lotti]|nr:hypothetical protein [Candidatus Thiodiazotropha lotti]MCW4196968.1 hypothetical protein [Candidatus Thiodiazotropha lotti]MCW4199767.1 hypothetical protein [Candidatus Thiodiazotropha lotti]MCW4202972.1 hypothetical protein [Candidatus Thiodiazotropha lotti]MCW4208628.1 hypothetical protein [Candidatus Thiodiazotropha lotti]